MLKQYKNYKALIIVLIFILPWIPAVTARASVVYDDPAPLLLKYATLNELASSIVGQDITVHCEDLSMDETGHTFQVADLEGNVYFQPDIWFQKYVCTGLLMLMHYAPKKFSSNSTWEQDRYDLMGVALITLVHEASHIILNSANEGIVECYAFKHLRSTLLLFDLPVKVHRGTLQAAREQHYAAPEPYQSVC